MKRYALGIDIGGTKVAMVLGSRSGKIIGRREILTQKGPKAGACLQDIFFNVRALMKQAKVRTQDLAGIGVGIPGAVNTRTGIVPRSPHMTGWQGLPLGKILSRELKLKVRITNDANAAALGENRFGVGRNEKNFIYMTISTGIGGGLISNGRLIEGASYVGGEVGHMILVPDGNPCKCGHAGCLEAYGSGTAIAGYFRNQVSKGRRSAQSGSASRPGEKTRSRWKATSMRPIFSGSASPTCSTF